MNLLLEFLHLLDMRGDLMLQSLLNNSCQICQGERHIKTS